MRDKLSNTKYHSVTLIQCNKLSHTCDTYGPYPDYLGASLTSTCGTASSLAYYFCHTGRQQVLAQLVGSLTHV